MSEILQELLTNYAIDQTFRLLGLEVETMLLVYIYVIAASLSLIYVILSYVFGSVTEIVGLADDGTFPAVAIALGIFSACGGLSLFFMDASPRGSMLFGLIGGIIAFTLVIYSIRWLAANTANAVFSESALNGLTGTCYMSMSPGKPGQVTVNIGGAGEVLKAWSEVEISEGDKVVVIDTRTAREVEVAPVGVGVKE